MRKILLIATCLSFIGCQSPTKYQPINKSNDFGYKSYELNKDFYRVVFKGNSATTKQQVESGLLLRIAELTLENGYKNFIITDKDTDVEKSGSDERRLVFPRSPYGDYAWGRFDKNNSFPYYTSGYPWAYTNKPAVRTKEYTATAFVKMTNDETPNRDGNLFSAEMVSQILRKAMVATQ